MKKKTTARWMSAYVSLGLFFASPNALFSQQVPPPPPPPDDCGFDLSDLRPSYRNSRMVGGVITDMESKSLIGANICVSDSEGKYMSYGTVSDVDGAFQLYIPITDDDLYLTFSYIGFEKKSIKLKKIHPPLSIRLESIAYELSEVVVTAPKPAHPPGGCVYSLSDVEDKAERIQCSSIVVGKVYPNPFKSELHANLETLASGLANFHLFDAVGRLVMSQTETLQEGVQTVSFNLNKHRLPGGVYYLRISNAGAEIGTHSVVKVDD